MPSPPEDERADRRTVQRNVQVERWGDLCNNLKEIRRNL